MIHYVFLKFKPGYFNDDVLNYTKNAFKEIGKLDGIQVVKIEKNCVVRDANMDMMIQLDLKNKDTLKFYLEHDLHQDYVKNIVDNIDFKVSFDHE